MACVALAACGTTPRPASPAVSPPASLSAPASAAPRQMSTYDMATEYTVDYVPDGFTLTVNYRYMNYVLRTSTAETQCKAAVHDVATSLSERRQHPIAAIDARQIRMVTTRKWTGASPPVPRWHRSPGAASGTAVALASPQRRPGVAPQRGY